MTWNFKFQLKKEWKFLGSVLTGVHLSRVHSETTRQIIRICQFVQIFCSFEENSFTKRWPVFTRNIGLELIRSNLDRTLSSEQFGWSNWLKPEFSCQWYFDNTIDFDVYCEISLAWEFWFYSVWPSEPHDKSESPRPNLINLNRGKLLCYTIKCLNSSKLLDD